MIRVALISKHYASFARMISEFLESQNIEFVLSNYRHQSIQDLYFIEIEKKEDLAIADHLRRLDSTLIYIIGPRDFDLVSYCLTLSTDLYFVREELPFQLQKYADLIKRQIHLRFRYYIYHHKGMTMKIRISQIYYVESFRYMLIIHSINGEMSQRKPLSQFLKELDVQDFIQIHKSYAVNQKYIKVITASQVVLKDDTVLPIGRNYKNNLKNKQEM